MFVPEDLNVRVRISIAQHLQRWQSEDKIANRSAADHQNAVHTFTVATARWDRPIIMKAALYVDPGGLTNSR
jgi:hypothetical protein